MKLLILLLILLSLTATALAQIPAKSLSFAQIAFGGGYETVLNLTNRGTSIYNGTLTLRPTDSTREFPAQVNGRAFPASGQMGLSLDPGATRSIRIQSSAPAAGILSGFATIRSTSPETDNLLDGNLTYYVTSANGTILDSIGVAPSRLVQQSVIPFDDFQTVALALALPGGTATATTQLTLFDHSNVRIGALTQVLAPNQHVPKFLSEFFPGVSLTRGRVEITSNIGIIGTALTFVKGGQASSLPFLQSTMRYDITGSLGGETFTAHGYFAVDGLHVTGYVFDIQDGVPQPPADPIVGIVRNGNLELLSREGSSEIHSLVIPGFSAQAPTQTGTVTLYSFSSGETVQGTVTLKAIN